MDRGYIDFAATLSLHAGGLAFFVTRAKRNLDFARRSSRRWTRPPACGAIRPSPCGPKTSRRYPQPLRRISYVDADIGKRFVFLTNNFRLPALTIAQLYRCRWQVELFFKWIKQYLRIKAFFGTSVNAVKTQMWIAISVYVLVAIVKKRLDLTAATRANPANPQHHAFREKPILQVFSHDPATTEVTLES